MNAPAETPPTVSIVVPFYGVEAYIGACLESLVHQTHGNIEVLCVDDCSPDGSLDIVQRYAANDDRVKILRHELHKGPGGARNTGLRHAKGDYVCFVDSDDYVSEQFVELLLRTLIEHQADIAVCDIWRDEDGTITPHETRYQDDCLTLAGNKENAIQTARRFNPACTNKMLKRQLLVENNVFQSEHRCYGEGVAFWLKAVFFSSKICSLAQRLYYYRKRHGSTTAKFTETHVDDHFDFVREIDDFVKKGILAMPQTDEAKILDDACYYLLQHISYGEKEVQDSNIEDKQGLIGTYRRMVARFAAERDWPALPVAYELFKANNLIRGQLNTEKAAHQETQNRLSRAAAALAHGRKRQHLYLGGLLASVILNIVLLGLIASP